MFLTSGLIDLRLRRFALYDTTAAAISVSALFFLAYHFGEGVEKPFQAVGVVLFILLLSLLTFVVIRIIRKILKRPRTEALRHREHGEI